MNSQTLNGANVLLETLENHGVEYIFGNPGTTELPLMDALLEKPNIQYILGLQEASVVAMADGYAQAPVDESRCWTPGCMVLDRTSQVSEAV